MHWLATAVLRFLLWGLWTPGQERAPPGLDHRGGAETRPGILKSYNRGIPQAGGAWTGPRLWILADEPNRCCRALRAR